METVAKGGFKRVTYFEPNKQNSYFFVCMATKRKGQQAARELVTAVLTPFDVFCDL